MTVRREVLKMASLVPLAILDTALTNPAEAQEQNIQPNSHQGNVHLEKIPAPPEPTTKEFSNYHLLGHSEGPGTLFGEKRPADWREVKTQLTKELVSEAKPTDPIHAWLQTFSQTFDDHSADIVLTAVSILNRTDKPAELRYEPQLYDILLRSAATQLDRCLRYRNEMGGFEVVGVSAGIAYLTFLKLKPIQRNIILQSSLAELDALTKSAEGRSSVYFGRAAHGFSGLFEKYHMVGLQSQADGSAAEAGYAEAKERLRTSLLERQFNLQADAQLAEFTRMLTPGSSSNSAERYQRLLAMVTEDLADAYCKLYSASKGVQQVLQIKDLSVGLNHAISADIDAFKERSALQSWVQKVVPSQDQRQPDVLDALVLWCRAMMRESDRRSQYETEFTLAIPLNQPCGGQAKPLLSQSDMNVAFNQPSPTGKVSFVLQPVVLPFAIAPSSLRLLGIGLSVEHSIEDFSPVQYSSGFKNAPPKPVVAVGSTPSFDANPPHDQVTSVTAFEQPKTARLNATITTPPQAAFGAGATYQRPAVLLTNVRLQGGVAGDLEPLLSYDLGCRNANPFGAWSIQLDRNAIQYYASAAALTNEWVSGLILHLRLRALAA